jgi:hypothetical protein
MVCQSLKPHCVTAAGRQAGADRCAPDGAAGRCAGRWPSPQAGADLISFHPDASGPCASHPAGHQVQRRLQGRAWCSTPPQSLDVLDWVIEDIDLVLVMSRQPGVSAGKAFIDSGAAQDRRRARRRIDASRPGHPAGGRRRHQDRKTFAAWPTRGPTPSSRAAPSSGKSGLPRGDRSPCALSWHAECPGALSRAPTSGLDVAELFARLQLADAHHAGGRELGVHAELVFLQAAVLQGDFADLEAYAAGLECADQ